MSFGLAGAHGTGKSTLAKALQEAYGIPYYDGSSGRIMKLLGYQAVSQMPLKQRVEAQQAYLKRYLEEINTLPRPFITDRTPLDMIAYMLAETSMFSDASLAPAIMGYVDDCLKATLNTFDTVIFVKPFGVVPEREGKPPVNAAYQTQIQFLIEGTISCIHKRLGGFFYLSARDLETRIDAIAEIMEKRMTKMGQRRSLSVLH